MAKPKNWILFYSTMILPVIPLLYLFNKNAKYLSFTQVLIIVLVLVAVTSAIFAALKSVFRSELTAFFACLVMNIVLFSYNSLYYNFFYTSKYAHAGLLLIPLLSYIAAYVFSKLMKGKSPEQLPKIIAVIVSVMLVINIFNTTANVFNSNKIAAARDNKLDFIVDKTLPAPNVYWILCDGMLGFDAMEKYFNEPQGELRKDLSNRGFAINTGAMLESGHFTKTAIPALMSPAYCDKYMKPILESHEKAMAIRESVNPELFNACYYNETINAFDTKGYTTISISVDEDYFFPTTDYFYCIATPFMSQSKSEDMPYYIYGSNIQNSSYFKSKFYTKHLSSLFLGNIPYMIFEYFNENTVNKYQVPGNPLNIDEILPGSVYAKRHSSFIDSLYDAVYSHNSESPKFVTAHNFMAHFPICFDENGNLIKDQNSIAAYPGHHKYATNALVCMIDMIIEADPDAVIVLQADHGVHEWDDEKIRKAFKQPEAKIDLWNNVFSAIRVPEKFQNGEEQFALKTPLNMSRYLVNSFVGQNYEYATADPSR